MYHTLLLILALVAAAYAAGHYQARCRIARPTATPATTALPTVTSTAELDWSRAGLSAQRILAVRLAAAGMPVTDLSAHMGLTALVAHEMDELGAALRITPPISRTAP